MPKQGGRSARQWMLWAFKLHGCADCGVRYPDIPLQELHCDHVDPSRKAGTKARSIRGLGAKDHGLLGRAIVATGTAAGARRLCSPEPGKHGEQARSSAGDTLRTR